MRVPKKTKTMKKIALLFLIAGVIFFYACKKNSESANFSNLTSVTWTSDSLLANGVKADSTGQMLAKFKGDAKFNKDGSGTFGQYQGTWKFNIDETKLVINSDSLQLPITANIVTLTTTALKITTLYPNILNPAAPFNIRMTFKSK